MRKVPPERGELEDHHTQEPPLLVSAATKTIVFSYNILNFLQWIECVPKSKPYYPTGSVSKAETLCDICPLDTFKSKLLRHPPNKRP